LQLAHDFRINYRKNVALAFPGGNSLRVLPAIPHKFNLTRRYMNLPYFLENYWPFLALGLWFAYKWWNSRRVIAMLPELRRKGAVFVDVRSAGEFATGNAPGTINIPLQELASRLSEVPKSSPIVLCCASGSRSGMAKLLLKAKGYPKVHNIGTWSKLLA
jgi:rhodanese-related sulfurtransferase